MDEKTVKKGLRISIIQGLFSNIHITLTGGMFLTGFALYLGATPFHIGLLAAIPALLTSFGFVSAYLVNRLEHRKPLTIITSSTSRLLFFIPALLLLFNYKPSLSHFLILIGIFNALLTIADNSWLSWMSDLVPRESRGRFFGIRNTGMGLIGMIMSFSGARFLDYYKAQSQNNFGFGIIFLVASIAATIGTILLTQQPEIVKPRERTSLKKIVTAPFKDTNFRKFLKFVGFWNITSGIAGPFYIVFMLQNLKMSYSTVAIYSIIANSVILIFQPLWGKAIDRFKSKPVLFINFIFIGFLPLLWIFPTPLFLFPVWLDAFITGVFWPGVNLSVFNIVFSLSDNEEQKESYFAMYATLAGICGFISALLGGYLAGLLKGFHLQIFGLNIVNYQLFFVFAGLTRFIALFLLKGVSEAKATSPSYALGIMTDYALRRLNYGKEFILNTIRFLKPK
ncbi:MAG: MFS transporter [Candidatus Latescibacteria bacterium]|nr:MFS transporter [Candidatus Latescibacterota bacterium]